MSSPSYESLRWIFEPFLNGNLPTNLAAFSSFSDAPFLDDADPGDTDTYYLALWGTTVPHRLSYFACAWDLGSPQLITRVVFQRAGLGVDGSTYTPGTAHILSSDDGETWVVQSQGVPDETAMRSFVQVDTSEPDHTGGDAWSPGGDGIPHRYWALLQAVGTFVSTNDGLAISDARIYDASGVMYHAGSDSGSGAAAPQGRTTTLDPDGTQEPAYTQAGAVTWDILRAGTPVATSSAQNGWYCAWDGHHLYIHPPATADVTADPAAPDYEVRLHAG